MWGFGGRKEVGKGKEESQLSQIAIYKLTTPLFHHSHSQNKPKSKVWYFFQRPSLLFFVGVLSALVAYVIDGSLVFVHWFREHLYTHYGAFCYICFSVLSGCLSASIVYFVCPRAAGSGVPEMKTMLSGVVDPQTLSMGALYVKSVGLIAAFAAGLSIGKMGPFVQISCIIADQLMRLPMCVLSYQLRTPPSPCFFPHAALP